MALALVTTVGAATANCYNTVAEVDAFAEQELIDPVAWSILNTEPRLRVMLAGMRVLERLTFPGERVDGTQALEWPRRCVTKADGYYQYATTEIPAGIKQAHAKLVFFLAEQLRFGVDPFGVVAEAGLSSISFGGELSMAFEKGSTQRSTGEQYLSTVIMPFLGHLVRATQASTVR